MIITQASVGPIYVGIIFHQSVGNITFYINLPNAPPQMYQGTMDKLLFKNDILLQWQRWLVNPLITFIPKILFLFKDILMLFQST